MNHPILSLALLITSLPALCAETLPIDPSHAAVIFSWNHRGFSHPVARLEQISGNVLNKIASSSDNKVTAGFDADVMLRRSDFGVGRYVPMTGDELRVHITLEAGQDIDIR